MTQSSEERFLSFLKQADSPELVPGKEENYVDQPEIEPERRIEAVLFSDAAQESSKDVREGTMSRLFDSKDSVRSRERALIGAMLDTKDYETSSINLKPVEKVSQPTLLDRVSRLGLL